MIFGNKSKKEFIDKNEKEEFEKLYNKINNDDNPTNEDLEKLTMFYRDILDKNNNLVLNDNFKLATFVNYNNLIGNYLILQDNFKIKHIIKLNEKKKENKEIKKILEKYSKISISKGISLILDEKDTLNLKEQCLNLINECLEIKKFESFTFIQKKDKAKYENTLRYIYDKGGRYIHGKENEIIEICDKKIIEQYGILAGKLKINILDENSKNYTIPEYKGINNKIQELLNKKIDNKLKKLNYNKDKEEILRLLKIKHSKINYEICSIISLNADNDIIDLYNLEGEAGKININGFKEIKKILEKNLEVKNFIRVHNHPDNEEFLSFIDYTTHLKLDRKYSINDMIRKRLEKYKYLINYQNNLLENLNLNFNDLESDESTDIKEKYNLIDDIIITQNTIFYIDEFAKDLEKFNDKEFESIKIDRVKKYDEIHGYDIFKDLTTKTDTTFSYILKQEFNRYIRKKDLLINRKLY